MTRIIPPAMLLLALSACTEAEAPKPVDWYKTNEPQRKAMIEACDQNGVPTSLDCVNASKADIALNSARRGYVKPKPVDFDGGH